MARVQTLEAHCRPQGPHLPFRGVYLGSALGRGMALLAEAAPLFGRFGDRGCSDCPRVSRQAVGAGSWNASALGLHPQVLLVFQVV